MFTETELRKLSEEVKGRWPSIPIGCPETFVQRICEKRAALIGYRATPSALAATGPQGEPLPWAEAPTPTSSTRRTAPVVSDADNLRRRLKDFSLF